METTKYPLLHKVFLCLSQYGNLNYCIKSFVVLDFIAPITESNVSCGVNSNKKCIWSSSPFISIIFMLTSSENLYKIILSLFKTSGVRQ